MAIVVFVTIPTKDSEKLIEKLLNERVCACVNIINNVKSYFWWQGKIDQAQESLLMIKTTDKAFSSLKKLIKSNHPYQVPEIIAFNIDQGNKDYLDWISQEVKPIL
ncbi:MAG: divalent-cation tolerance protein CutA [Candidatus Omnitrophica bacterium]|nr:divalent-cation tolerance protein CutA [Candidatus Omnitrophota bacterium]